MHFARKSMSIITYLLKIPISVLALFGALSVGAKYDKWRNTDG